MRSSIDCTLFIKYYYGDQIKEDEMGREYSTHAEMRNVYKILVGKPEWKRQLGRPRHRGEDIKLYLWE
jgi:hypothetical protein